MGFATHLGPWLLGTVKDTTGTTAGTIRNTGATVVSQSVAIGTGSTTANAFVLPAGALITGAQLITTTLYGAGTVKLSIGAVDISNTLTLPTTTPGAAALTLGAGGVSAAALIANVGSTDAIVTYTLASATTGAGTLVITYVVRNSDGTSVPASA